MLRTHNCGELRKEDVGKKVTLTGWVHTIRTHGALTFIDIRDRYGITQITIKNYKDLINISRESVIQVTGKVVAKPEKNPSLKTGEVEVVVEELNLINKADIFPIDDNATEETLMKYRYLYLRRPEMIRNLQFRNELLFATREYFLKHKFTEIETPMLVKSTPEGARDYVVPSRVNKGKFYALPQSPQLYKQILMIAGIDRYFQVARCLRDEDLRSDRQPEHTQIDFEMSFVESNDIRGFVEGFIKYLFKKMKNINLEPFITLTYDEAMNRFGTDKPDIRFGMELIDLTDLAKKSGFGVFKSAETIYGLFAPKNFSRKEIDKYTELVKIYKAKGLAYVKIIDEKLDSGIAKFLNDDNKIKKELLNIAKNSGGEGTFFFVADKKRLSQTALGQLRNKLRDDLEIIKNNKFNFCWVKDFPLFSWNEDENHWEPEHHMFSMPAPEFIDNFEKEPEKVTGDLWDLVMNGVELGSGSIRISNPEIQERIMNFIGISKEEANNKFGFLLEAYHYGAPIHGGMGLGVDRLIALMLGYDDIREVIAFPKNKNAECPMDGSPSFISKIQLDELHIDIKE